MNEKRYLLLIVLMIAVFLCGRAFDELLTPVPAQARPTDESRTAAGLKWEYCALTKAAYVRSSRGGLYWISYFRDAGVEVVEVEDSALERSGSTKAIARLGAEGWEMVGEGGLEIRPGGVSALYFKRPK